MVGSWRVQLCAARSLYEQGRLDEARRMLLTPPLCEFRPAQELLSHVAEAMAQRARERLAGGRTIAGAQDLAAAASVGAPERSLQAARQALVERLSAEARTFLEAGDPHAALQRLEVLSQCGSFDHASRKLWLAAHHWQAAQAALREGRVSDAVFRFEQAGALHPQCETLQAAAVACRQVGARLQTQLERLHGALFREAWQEAFAAAQVILEICPNHPVATAAISRAWAAAGLATAADVRQAQPGNLAGRLLDRFGHAPQQHANGRQHGSGLDLARCKRMERTQLDGQPELPEARSDRFVLWIDGVGGFLVCQAASVVIGQPDPAAPPSRGRLCQGSQACAPHPPEGGEAGLCGADVPILADISRRHARIRRVGEDYLLDPLREIRVNKRVASVSTLLVDGAELELNPGVRLRFRRPHPLCATARLEFVSQHRTHPPADAVLLAAGTCILGPHPTSHVVCRDWKHPVLLFRREDGWRVRYAGRFQVDGAWFEGEAAIGPRSQIAGEDFSFYLEPL